MAKNFRYSSIKNIDTAFLKNRALLYIILLLSLGNVYYMMVENNITFLMVFIIVGFLTSFFSKNMVVILSVAMAFTHVLRFGANVYKLEGFENEESNMEEEEDEEEKNEDIQYPVSEDDVQNSDSIEGIQGMDSSGNKSIISGKKSVATSKESSSPVSSNNFDFDLKSLMPSIKESIEENTGVQNKILAKLSGIEKFTNGLNEYIN
jgi:hypothetical protein